MSELKKILLSAPLLTLSGYGEQGRFALRSLLSRPDLYDVYINALNWGQCGWLHEDSEERRTIDELLHKTIVHQSNGGTYDISVQCTIPNEWQKLAPVNIGYTAGIETTRIAHQWIEKAREMDRIIVVSNHSKEVFNGTMYEMRDPQTNAIQGTLQNTTPIDVVNYPVKTFDPVEEITDLNFSTKFNLLCVGQVGPRKNVDNTVRWFVEEFHDDKDAGLVLKLFTRNTSLLDRDETTVILERLLKHYPDKKCKIHLLHGALSDAEMNSLYNNKSIKGLLTLTHGEGYGLPIFEAAYNGLPVIAPAFSGHLDFMMAPGRVRSKKKNAKPPPLSAQMLKVDFTLQPVPEEVVWDGVLIKDSAWAVPTEASAKSRMRDLKDNLRKHKATASRLQKLIVKNFDEKKIYGNFVKSVQSATGAALNVPVDVQVFK